MFELVPLGLLKLQSNQQCVPHVDGLDNLPESFFFPLLLPWFFSWWSYILSIVQVRQVTNSKIGRLVLREKWKIHQQSNHGFQILVAAATTKVYMMSKWEEKKYIRSVFFRKKHKPKRMWFRFVKKEHENLTWKETMAMSSETSHMMLNFNSNQTVFQDENRNLWIRHLYELILLNRL